MTPSVSLFASHNAGIAQPKFGSATAQVLIDKKRRADTENRSHFKTNLWIGTRNVSDQQFLATLAALGGTPGRKVGGRRLAELGIQPRDLRSGQILGYLESSADHKGQPQWSLTDTGYDHAKGAERQGKEIAATLLKVEKVRRQPALREAFKDLQVGHQILSGPEFTAVIAALSPKLPVNGEKLHNLGIKPEDLTRGCEAGLFRYFDIPGFGHLWWQVTPAGKQFASEALEKGRGKTFADALVAAKNAHSAESKSTHSG